MRFREVAKLTVAAEARDLATSMATMLAYDSAHASDQERNLQYQRIIAAVAASQQRDREVFDRNLVIVADVASEDVGTPAPQGLRRDSIAATLRDGQPRLITEGAGQNKALIHQVVVPVYDRQRRVIAALIYEYTPLYDSLLSRARDAMLVVGCAALLGLALALLCAAWISRSISAPLKQLTHAARQLAQGQRHVTVSTSSTDEVGALTRVFNKMSVALLASEKKFVETGANRFAHRTGQPHARLHPKQALAGCGSPPVPVAVNVSSRQLRTLSSSRLCNARSTTARSRRNGWNSN